MKKVLSVVLAFVIILSCVSVIAFAAGTKISETLAQMMEQTSDDQRITVHVWLYSTVDKEAARRQARQECGYIGGLPLNMSLDEVYAYKAAYNRIISEQEAAVANSFVGKLGIAEDDIVYLGKSPYVIANLTKAQINEAATYAEVESLSYVDAPVIEPADADTVNANLYEDKVKEIYPFLYDYRELYYHADGSGNVDWVMITGNEESVFPEPLYMVIGNRVVIEEQYTAPFGFGYAVYDVQHNTVKAIYSEMLDQYDGLEEAFNEYGCGRLLGDIDEDDDISIIDATILQRCEANISDYPTNDIIRPFGDVEGALTYYSDFNRDGERDILDATCLQRYLVGLYHWSDPIITNVQFEDIDNVYSHPHATVSVTGGTAPYTYCYKIKGIFHQYSDYGADLGEYDFDYEDMAPGSMNFSTGYFDENTTTIPVRALTYGDTFTLVVTVKDSAGRVSKPVSKQFVNMDATVIYV